jgi:hypothetical protein
MNKTGEELLSLAPMLLLMMMMMVMITVGNLTLTRPDQ